MKNLLIFAMILAAGTSAYPQATRSARESKSEKGSSRSEATRTVNRSESKSSGAKKSSGSTAAKRSNVERSRSADYNQKAATRSTERSVTSGSAQRQVSSGNTQRSTSSGNVQRSVRTENPPVRRYEGQNQSQNRTRTTTVTRPETKSGSAATRSVNVKTTTRSNEPSAGRGNTSSATRVFREGKGTLTRDDGSVIRHQNDEVFASRKYKLDYDNYENLRRSDDFRREYRDYNNWYSHRHIRVVNHYHNNYVPIPWEIRRVRYIYRRPVHIDLIWTPLLLHRFMYYYPTYDNWNIDFGREIETISAYDAMEYAGSVKRIYGKVEEVFYSEEDENYILYIGAPFPYHDVSVVVPKYLARNISMSPKWYFENEHIWVVGLINVWEGKPEIVVRDEDQIRRY